MNLLLLLVAALGATVGYLAGRFSVGTRLLGWAEDQCERHPMWHPGFLTAVPVLLAAIASAWVLHPKQTAANRRFWREQQALVEYGRVRLPLPDPVKLHFSRQNAPLVAFTRWCGISAVTRRFCA
ncbi:hypothetical protein [Streptomyces sulphureus]|uniref:hypothetical protein n=1 Tax=Streptomyces sulphureus TaxID=47758 RepID=UPI000365DB71|nr:hypothetical protein [Streptomyces sulphureus]